VKKEQLQLDGEAVLSRRKIPREAGRIRKILDVKDPSDHNYKSGRREGQHGAGGKESQGRRLN